MYLNNLTQTVKSAKMLEVSYKNIYNNINIVSLCISENFHVLSFIFPSNNLQAFSSVCSVGN